MHLVWLFGIRALGGMFGVRGCGVSFDLNVLVYPELELLVALTS